MNQNPDNQENEQRDENNDENSIDDCITDLLQDREDTEPLNNKFEGNRNVLAELDPKQCLGRTNQPTINPGIDIGESSNNDDSSNSGEQEHEDDNNNNDNSNEYESDTENTLPLEPTNFV